MSVVTIVAILLGGTLVGSALVLWVAVRAAAQVDLDALTQGPKEARDGDA